MHTMVEMHQLVSQEKKNGKCLLFYLFLFFIFKFNNFILFYLKVSEKGKDHVKA